MPATAQALSECPSGTTDTAEERSMKLLAAEVLSAGDLDEGTATPLAEVTVAGVETSPAQSPDVVVAPGGTAGVQCPPGTSDGDNDEEAERNREWVCRTDASSGAETRKARCPWAYSFVPSGCVSRVAADRE